MNMARSRKKEYASFIDDKFPLHAPSMKFELEMLLYDIHNSNNVENAYIFLQLAVHRFSVYGGLICF